MDGAEGPSSTEDDLQLGMKPNPVFTAIHEDDTKYTMTSNTTVRIMGENIDSVLADEITVLVDEHECRLTAEISATQIRCWPPDFAEPGDKEMKVIIANNSLDYSLGTLHYRTSSSSSSGSNTDVVVVVLPVLAGVLIFLLTCLVIAIIVLSCRVKKSLGTLEKLGERSGEETMENWGNQEIESRQNIYEISLKPLPGKDSSSQ